MKTAIVHDYLVQMGGAEKVVEALHEMYPDAPVYTSIHDPGSTPASYKCWDIRTSFLQRLPNKRITHRMALLLYPMAFESFDFSEYDVVISSSSSFAKGIITQPHTAHVCYCHSPMRFAWSTKDYLMNERVSRPFRVLLKPGTHYLRQWDALSSLRVDKFIANSTIVSQRIRKYYRAESEIIYPPVATSKFCLSQDVGDYYVIVSRAAPYRRLDLAIDAFTKLNIPLKLAGTGRQIKALRARAGANIEFLGRISDNELPELLGRARGYVMPGEEDFGITAVEALASGKPVVAYGRGGACETVPTPDMLYPEPSDEALLSAMEKLEESYHRINPKALRTWSLQFSEAEFARKMSAVLFAQSPVSIVAAG